MAEHQHKCKLINGYRFITDRYLLMSLELIMMLVDSGHSKTMQRTSQSLHDNLRFLGLGLYDTKKRDRGWHLVAAHGWSPLLDGDFVMSRPSGSEFTMLIPKRPERGRLWLHCSI